jgi:hypothetical protein
MDGDSFFFFSVFGRVIFSKIGKNSLKQSAESKNRFLSICSQQDPQGIAQLQLLPRR